MKTEVALLMALGGLAAVADPTASVAVEDYATCVPVVTATFDEGVSDVTFEWSDAEDGTYSTLGTVASPSGTKCAYTNSAALVASKRWYRVTVGEESSAAVAFTRFRRLDRDPNNARSSFRPGFKIANGDFYPFDGYPEHHGHDCGTLFCLNFGTPYHVAGCRFMPRPTCCSRIGNRYWYAAKTAEDYAAGNFVQMGWLHNNQQAYTWCWAVSPDTENTYQYAKLTADCGNLAEMQVYGWSVEEQSSPVGYVYCFAEDVNNLSNCAPVVTWTHPAGVDRVELQISRDSSRGFTTLAAIDHPTSASSAYTNETQKVGVTRYYRVKVVAGSETNYSAAVKHTRFRRIDRNPGQENVRFGKYTYFDYRFFDGVLDAAFDGSTIGLCFNERLNVVGVRTYPRPAWAGRLNGKTFYGYKTKDDKTGGYSTALCGPVLANEGKWQWTNSGDPDTPYYQIWVTSDYNNAEELQVFGWDSADTAAAEESVAPSALSASNGDEEGEVNLAWSGAMYIDHYQVQYREAGTEEWTTYEDIIEGAVTAYTIKGLANGKTYDVRLASVGTDGWEDFSPTANVTVFVLTPAGGTGLNALLMGNPGLKVGADRAFFEKRQFAGLDLSQTTSIFQEDAHTNATYSLASFWGAIELPLDGKYTLKVYTESKDGLAIYVDGVMKANKISCGGSRDTTLTLTKGRHDISIDWLNTTAQKTLRFTWALEGVFAETTVPASQLFPASDEELPPYDKLGAIDFRIPYGAYQIPRLEVQAGGKYRIYNSTGVASDSWTAYARPGIATLSTLLAGAASFEFTLNSTATAVSVAAFVASTNSADIQLFYLSASGWVRVKGTSSAGSDGNSGDRGPTEDGFPGAKFGYPYTMRIERFPKDTITFKARSAKKNASKQWVTICSQKVDQSDHGYFDYDVLRYGFTPTYTDASAVTISDIKWRTAGGILRIR